ncbi:MULTISPECIES: hypothetical protein [unclassified Nocardioides]|uniref:hypothetical protein n=1 Tax=unclassified Nocardioides TaxID=2615069 RepID=UPI00301525FC
MPIPRRPLAIAAPLVALLLAACAVRGGAQTVTDFEDWLAEHPFEGMAVADATSAEALPFAGSADITVTVAGTDVGAAAAHVCDFDPPGAATLALSVSADGLAVPVDCDDPAASATTWEVVAGIDGLTDVAIAAPETVAVFDDTEAALAGWDALRRLRSASYTVEGPTWVLTDRPGTSAAARAVARDALSSIYIVERVSVLPATESGPEHVDVEVAFDAPLLERELLTGHPERRDLVTVREGARVGGQTP